MAERDHSDTVEQDELRIERDGATVHFILDRARALNALNNRMKSALADAVPEIARNPDIYCVIWRSESERAFCAGGDVRELIRLAEQDRAGARQSLADEYALNWLLDCFSKPTVALLNGFVMGSGAGLAQYATHRVAGENYGFAMPETAIGFFPDVGVAHILAGLPDHTGIYLGLTGRTIDRADAFALGLVTHCIDAGQFTTIQQQLADAQTVDPLLDGRHVDPGPPPLAPFREIINATFCAEQVEEIVDRLQKAKGRGAEADRWIDGVISDLLSRSPTALKVTLRHLLGSRRRGLRETLIADYRLGCHFLDSEDLHEGVRAVLVDKDAAPTWRPALLSEITEAMVDRYFAEPEDGDLQLLTRDEMQAARV